MTSLYPTREGQEILLTSHPLCCLSVTLLTPLRVRTWQNVWLILCIIRIVSHTLWLPNQARHTTIHFTDYSPCEIRRWKTFKQYSYVRFLKFIECEYATCINFSLEINYQRTFIFAIGIKSVLYYFNPLNTTKGLYLAMYIHVMVFLSCRGKIIINNIHAKHWYVETF